MTSTANWVADMAAERPIQETLARYDKWATTYDQDVLSGGISGPQATCKLIASLNLRKDSVILDAGAGTGRLGKLLSSEGFTNLHALDGSQEMLRVAQESNCYKSYTQGILGEGFRTTLEENDYDAVVMVGVFAPGHFGPDVLPELIRLTKPGGIVCWGQRDPSLYADRSDLFKDGHFHRAVVDVCAAHNCTLEQSQVPLPGYYKDTNGHGYVLRKK